MKIASATRLIFCVNCIVSCSNLPSDSDSRSNQSKRNYGKELIDKGFLAYADSSVIESLQKEILNSFYIYDENVYRIAHIDAEELAEFSFHSFLPDLNKNFV